MTHSIACRWNASAVWGSAPSYARV